MARSLDTGLINELEANLECTVCLERLNDPRTLPCCHSLCKVCLDGVVKTCRDKAHRDRPIREIPCPNCRTTFVLELADMPRNRFICNTVQAMAAVDLWRRGPCSHNCSSHNCSQSYSVARCVTCKKFLCRECLTDHNKYRGNNGHSVLEFSMENRRKVKDKMYCNKHSGLTSTLTHCWRTYNQLICKDSIDCEHHSCVPVKDEGKRVATIEQVRMDDYDSLVIEVTGINPNTSEDTLNNYFASPRHGGNITNIEYTRGSGNAFITFDNAEGVKKAFETTPHHLENSPLTIWHKKVETLEEDKVFVDGISPKTSKACLQFYMERISDLEVKNITYGAEKRNAVVTFDSTIDFDKIQTGLKKRPTLDGKNLSIKIVPVSKTILVKNLPASATYDSVLHKFKNKRAGGGEIERVDLDLKKRIALVEFKDARVIDNVLSKPQTLDDTTLSVERFNPVLGSLADMQLTEQKTSQQTCTRVPSKAKPFVEYKPPQSLKTKSYRNALPEGLGTSIPLTLGKEPYIDDFLTIF